MRAHLALAAVSTIWGLSYLGTKVALRDMGPFELATVRTLIAGVIFLPVFVSSRRALSLRESQGVTILSA